MNEINRCDLPVSDDSPGTFSDTDFLEPTQVLDFLGVDPFVSDFTKVLSDG